MLLEYLAYRMYGVIADASVRARLVAVRYVDTSRPDSSGVTRFGFFIEDVRTLARRLGTKRNKDSPGERKHLDARVLNRLEVFQYMLGNADWSPVGSEPGEACCHNAYLLRGTPPIPVPYDFDMSGFVNALYAAQNLDIGVPSPSERVYLGGCTTNDELPATLEFFRSTREPILAPLRAQSGLSERRRRLALDYLQEFFEGLNHPRAVARLAGKCLS